MSNRPKCEEYKVWVGNEIEGHVDLGEPTLFIRNLGDKYLHYYLALPKAAGIRRIWFCHEFWQHILNDNEIEVIREAVRKGYKVCVEMIDYFTPNFIGDRKPITLPKDFYGHITVYFKIPVDISFLRPTDFVCVGMPFKDTAFSISQGKSVNPEDYGKDVKIA